MKYDVQLLSVNEVIKYTEEVINHFLSLSKEDLYKRFMQTRSEYSIREWWKSIFKNEYINHRFVLVWDSEKVIALGQISKEKSSRAGEISISVSPEYRQNGLATYMFSKLENIAKISNLEAINLVCCSSNQTIFQLAKKNGFKFSVVEGDYYGIKEL